MIKIGKNILSFSAYSCQPKTKDELRSIIKSRIDKDGYECDLNDIDVSLITCMSSLFADSSFNGDISNWDVRNVNDMCAMFYDSSFDKDISNWKINRKCNTLYMFDLCLIEEEYKPKALQSC